MLSRGRIANLIRAPARTIAYHLAAGRIRRPGLEDEHAAAAGTGGSTIVTPGSRERMDQLIALVQAEDRYPSPGSPDAGGADAGRSGRWLRDGPMGEGMVQLWQEQDPSRP